MVGEMIFFNEKKKKGSNRTVERNQLTLSYALLYKRKYLNVSLSDKNKGSQKVTGTETIFTQKDVISKLNKYINVFDYDNYVEVAAVSGTVTELFDKQFVLHPEEFRVRFPVAALLHLFILKWREYLLKNGRFI